MAEQREATKDAPKPLPEQLRDMIDKFEHGGWTGEEVLAVQFGMLLAAEKIEQLERERNDLLTTLIGTESVPDAYALASQRFGWTK